MNQRFFFVLIAIFFTSCSKEILQQKLTVTVNPINGGTVSPPSNTFEKGQTIQLLATPASEYVFKEWTGDLIGNVNPSSLTMNSDKSVSGNFEKRQYPLNLTIEGSGTVKEEVIAVATQSQYPSGTTVRLTPQPMDGWDFSDWSGDLTSRITPLDLKIERPINIKCSFKKMNITSLRIENPIDSLTISNKYKFIVKGIYENGKSIDYSDSVRIASTPGFTVLQDNSILALKSGSYPLEIIKGKLKLSFTIKIKDFEFLQINPELAKNNGAPIQVPIIILSYLPTENGKDLNQKEGPDGYWKIHNSTLEAVKRKILNESIMAKRIWEEGSRFRNFNTTNSQYQINVNPIAFINVYEMEFIQNTTYREINYKKLFDKLGLNEIINSKNVKEIWFNHFPLYEKPSVTNNRNLYPDTKLYWGLDESNMSSPTTPDISNSSRKDDLPKLKNTYVVYAFNQSMGISNHVHCRGHQIEVQMSFIENKVLYPPAKDIENTIFWGKFVGIVNKNGGWDFKPGRVGRTHNPPNTFDNEQYQYSNTRKWLSDIKDWNPDGGKMEEIDHFLWNNIKYNFDFGTYQGLGEQSYTSEVNWLIFMFQSIPGFGNNIKFNSGGKIKSLSNWWDLFYNWDDAIKNKKTLWVE